MIQVHVRVSTVLIVKTSKIIIFIPLLLEFFKSSAHFFQDEQSGVEENVKRQRTEKKVEENQASTRIQISPGKTIYFIFFNFTGKLVEPHLKSAWFFRPL